MSFRNKIILYLISFTFPYLSAAEFTVSSYNAGGLSDHYDYLRAASMQKIMEERYIAEPENLSLNEKIQKLALKILFAPDSPDKTAAQQEWDRNGYSEIVDRLTSMPNEPNSPNALWSKTVEDSITAFKVRPILMQDAEVTQMLDEHLRSLSGDISEARSIMARRIFAHHLKFDIICLQETTYLEPSLFPEHYQVELGQSPDFDNGIAWNKERFELVEKIGAVAGKRGYAVLLRDKETSQTLLVVSGHLKGCNPYRVENNDSEKGDKELRAMTELFSQHEADYIVIGMDSNVTSLHPRLNILKDAGFKLDYENNLEMTCANPHQVLNTRIDWIAIKSRDSKREVSITNVMVPSVGLNSLHTNMSDHKPIAAKIKY